MSEICDWNDLVEREGLFYRMFTDVPFTGEVTGRGQGILRNGKREGPWANYHDNGQLRSKGIYKDGGREGPWVLHNENGQLWSKRTYKDGMEDGPWIGYHDTGRLHFEGTYKDGKKDGPWFYYKKDGTVDGKHTATYKDGVEVVLGY